MRTFLQSRLTMIASSRLIRAAVRSLARPIRAGTLAEGEELGSNLLRVASSSPESLSEVPLGSIADHRRNTCGVRFSSNRGYNRSRA